MKKLGILAISSLLFFAVSCKKSNPSPDSSGNYSVQGTGATPGKNMSDPMNAVNTATTTDLDGLSGSPVVNKVVPVRASGVINREDINPATDNGRYIVRPIPIRNDMNDPYNNPSRLVKGRKRNDMQNPFNDPK